MFDPKNKGRILMLDDMREVFAAALKSGGIVAQQTDPEILEQAADQLKQQKQLVETYNSGDFANLLAAGDVDLAHGYNGEIAEVVAEAPTASPTSCRRRARRCGWTTSAFPAKSATSRTPTSS